ncbi:ATP-dependent Clp protease ATP-binding subunit [Candidatus Pacearchaeota archaeon]|nr:ATP-dependent Clp protease ATP-binding subunit [Candidatus Pacearchaeota archaeon]
MGIFQYVTKPVLLDGRACPVEFIKLSPNQMRDMIVKGFKLENLASKEDYIPKITNLCIRNNISAGGFAYKDTIALYKAVISINPSLKYETIAEGIDIDLTFSTPVKDLSVIPEVQTKVDKVQTQIDKAKEDGGKKYKSVIDTIANVNFEDLEKRLSEKVIGQEEAMKQILKPLINTKHRGMPNDGVPSFYMMGPSGSGKTSSVRTLAEDILEVPFLHISGSEYGEEHTASKLFGAPPGYIGFDERGGRLTDFIKNYSESIILFDEIDKVNPKIYGALTSFLGDRFVTVNTSSEKKTKEDISKKYYFKGYIFFTSNTGNKSSEQGVGRSLGFGADLGMSENNIEKKRIMSILRKQGISEAFLGRITSFIRFNELGNSSLHKILDNYIGEANDELKYYKIKLAEKAKNKIINLGEPSKWGARNIYNNLDRFIVSELNYEFEMEHDIEEGSEVFVNFKNNEFTYSADKKIFLRKNSDYF